MCASQGKALCGSWCCGWNPQKAMQTMREDVGVSLRIRKRAEILLYDMQTSGGRGQAACMEQERLFFRSEGHANNAGRCGRIPTDQEESGNIALRYADKRRQRTSGLHGTGKIILQI